MVPDNFERVLGQAGTHGLYESHYLKANAPGGAAFWLKYCLLCPTAGASAGPRVAELWAVVWAGKGAEPIVVKRTVPADRLLLGERELFIDLPGVAHLDPTRASGDLDDGAHHIRWSLAITAPEAPLFHYPLPGMYAAALPKSKAMTPAPRARFSGELVVDGVALPVGGWVGMRGHNWGREHAHRYAYGNCSLWDDGPDDLHVDGFSAKVRLGGMTTPFLSAIVVRQGGRDLAFNGLRALASRKVRVEFPRWWASLERPGMSLELAMEADPADFVGLRYLHPGGGVSHCYNTKHAALRMTLRTATGMLTARSHHAELELLEPEPLPGLRLHGNAAPLRREELHP